MLRNRYNTKTLVDVTTLKDKIVDTLVISEVEKYRAKLEGRLGQEKVDWESFSTFWPPRLVDNYQADKLICFFGAGLSMPSGLPSWGGVFSQYFGLEKSILSDEDLKSDPLTLAELASHQVGADRLQVVLRQAISDIKTPSANHLIVASLRLPFYVTTNYDVLFETAWDWVNRKNGIELVTIVNEAELRRYFEENKPINQNPNKSFLFKIHGSVDKKHENEHLILTRSDYRHHYRVNLDFFAAVRELLSNYHVLFLGFSHQDPEVTKLVEDVIFKHEEEKKGLNLYSLQFDMRLHTPEIFGARGFLALNPPDVYVPEVKDYKSLQLAQALIDLIGAAEKDFHKDLSLDKDLQSIADKVSNDLKDGLDKIVRRHDYARDELLNNTVPSQWLEELRDDLGVMAGQGVYLVDSQGIVQKLAVPDGLDRDFRMEKSKSSFRERPYFKIAKTFPKSFVSDSYKSTFNDLATFFLCVPIHDHEKFFIGLLFSACQIGVWKLPIDKAEQIWTKDSDLSFLLIDSNGVCLVPPNKEFEPITSKWAGDKEKEQANRGYSFNKLLRLSRRDKLVSRLMQNVVPLRQDDDVLSLSGDLKNYTVVTELKETRWKVGISKAIVLANVQQPTRNTTDNNT